MLVNIDKILYTTDLTIGSSEAFKYAAFLAKNTGADIHILHVLEKRSKEAKQTLETYVIDEDSRKEALDGRFSHAQEKLKLRQNEFWSAVDEQDQSARRRIKSITIVESHPTDAILKLARDLSVDMIVMGTHEKGFVETLLGSVAKKVLAKSRIPVLAVPLPEK
ncbi:MAG: universal stress protein [Motiliproteus sp.]